LKTTMFDAAPLNPNEREIFLGSGGAIHLIPPSLLPLVYTIIRQRKVA
jgi:hypothetical protein